MSEKWYEQSNEQGDIFLDKYIHPECDLIKVWDSREEIKDVLKNFGIMLQAQREKEKNEA
tara:strand:+ start:213 stop:392 length:180 start_codon:yes stop_codon:yes gene_type:complete